ncbi:hypothetical protein DYB32_009425 [Aphanomyces invadans]|uniref:Uncharacterized protein n=1 Tax=Aphanomyces invadans TaxID=157072 RepID=A0A418AIG1_9STRA|nr:hypothetical protein DYB32_009425 [Aphanomyces invadans]
MPSPPSLHRSTMEERRQFVRRYQIIPLGPKADKSSKKDDLTGGLVSIGIKPTSGDDNMDCTLAQDYHKVVPIEKAPTNPTADDDE